MAKYRIVIHVDQDEGKRGDPIRVRWHCGKLPNMHPMIARHEPNPHLSPETVDSAEQGGIYECLRHAEAAGETLAAADVEVVTEWYTHRYRRGRAEGTAVRTTTFGPSNRIFAEVNGRPRPL